MASREERRDRLRAKMRNDAANIDKKGGKNQILNFSDYEDVNFYKTIKGKNEIDIFSFEITTDKDPEGGSIGDDNYKLEYWRHTEVGPEDNMVLCLLKTYGKPCPICEERDRMIAELEAKKVAEPWKDKGVAALKPKQRCLYNVIDLNASEKGMQIFDHNWAHFEHELFARATYKNPDFALFADFEEGYTVEFRGAQSDFSEKYIEPKDFDFEPRDPYNEKEIRSQTYPFDAMLNIPTYEEVQNMFMGVEGEEDEPEPPKKERKKKAEPKSEKEEKPARGRRGKAKDDLPPEEDIDIFNCPAGCIAGKDWDNQPACKECADDDYERCGAQYELWKAKEERLEKEAKKEEPKEEPAPTTRRRNKRR